MLGKDSGTAVTHLGGKHVLITGAAGAVGSAVSDRALGLGARLTLIDRASDDNRPEGHWLSMDLLDRASVANRLSSIDDIDVAIHLAGGFDMGTAVHETSPAELEAMVALNVVTLLNVLHAVVPRMRERRSGSIVTVGAHSALKGRASMGAYCAAKSMVMRLSESTSAELKDNGINVNCVLPSIIDTLSNRRSMPNADASHWVSPREIADVICFLCSDAASALHGAMVPVCGRI